MIHTLNPYPAMKDSGVSWLGQVPEHWKALTIRRFSRVFAGATPSRAIPAYWDEGSIPWLASGDVNQRSIKHATQFITQEGFDNSSTKWINPGSVVLALAGQGKTKGLCATVEFKTTCNQSLAVIEPKENTVDYKFLAYYLESRYLEIRSLVGELRDGLNLEHVKDIPVPLPSPDEQAAIVRYLDYADRRIRRTIATKQRLIKLLQEQKQVIIHQAVTRGLDPDVKLKPSGVEWLGDVPEGWEVKRVSNISQFLNGKAHEQYVEPDGQYICVTARFVSTGGEDGRRCTANFCPGKKGDIFMVMSDLPRGRALARAYYVDDDRQYAVNQRVCILRAFDINSKFLAYYANRNPQLLANDDGSNQTHLSNYDFKTLRVPIPPPELQEKIVKELDNMVMSTDDLIRRSTIEISLLREYRTRLIADVVTGKLDVRVAAAQLPALEGDLPEEGDVEIEADLEGDEPETEAAEALA